MTKSPSVGIIMGSQSDWPVLSNAKEILEELPDHMKHGSCLRTVPLTACLLMQRKPKQTAFR